jgi:hypothetical protein
MMMNLMILMMFDPNDDASDKQKMFVLAFCGHCDRSLNPTHFDDRCLVQTKVSLTSSSPGGVPAPGGPK